MRGATSRWQKVGLLLAALVALRLSPAVAREHGKKPAAGAEDKRQGGAESESHDKAKQLVQQGSTALAGQDLAAAARALTAAYRLAPSPEILYQLGRLAAAENRLVDAQDLFRRFLHDTSEPEQSPARQEAERVLKSAAPPTGEVNVVGDRNVLVTVDGRLVGVLPLPLPLLLAAGEHRFVLEHGSNRLEDSVTVMAGRLAELRCQFNLGVMVVSIQPALLLLADHPGIDGEPAQRLLQAVAQAARAVHLGVVARTPALVQVTKPLKLDDCLQSPRCQLELAAQNQLQHVLVLSAQRRPGTTADWQLKAALLDTTIGDAAVELTPECPGCTAERASELLGQTAATAIERGLTRARGALAIESTPAGAEVLLGERLLGVTPLQKPYWAGELALTFRHPGYRTQRAELTVVAGETARLQQTLTASSDIQAPPPTVTRTVVLPRPRWRIGVGAAALGVGAGVLALGISALSVNGSCVPHTYVNGSCQNVYMTSGIGAGLMVGGALFLAGGVTLLALPGERRQVVVPAN